MLHITLAVEPLLAGTKILQCLYDKCHQCQSCSRFARPIPLLAATFRRKPLRRSCPTIGHDAKPDKSGLHSTDADTPLVSPTGGGMQPRGRRRSSRGWTTSRSTCCRRGSGRCARARTRRAGRRFAARHCCTWCQPPLWADASAICCLLLRPLQPGALFLAVV